MVYYWCKLGQIGISGVPGMFSEHAGKLRIWRQLCYVVFLVVCDSSDVSIYVQ